MAPHSRTDPAGTPKPTALVVAVNPLRGYRLGVEVDGVLSIFEGSEVTAADRRQLRRTLGVTVDEIVAHLAGGKWSEPDILGALVFLARRTAGERDSLADAGQVAEGVAAADSVRIIFDPEDDDSGEVRAAL